MTNPRNDLLGWLVRKTSLPASARTSLFSPSWLVSRALYRFIGQSVRYASGTVLDIGCGTMPYRFFFEDAQQVKRYVGLDYPPTKVRRDTAIRSAVIRDVVSSPRRPNVLGTALPLPIASNSIDTVVSFQVLEHVPDPDRMISEVHRVLKENGCAVITTNFLWPLHEEPFDFFRFTQYGLTYLFEQNGFQVMELRAIGGGWMTFGQILSNYMCGAFVRLGIKFLFLPLGFLIQIVFSLLDRMQSFEKATSHYIAVARKTNHLKITQGMMNIVNEG
jgi:SAM-dependent methyltransferase